MEEQLNNKPSAEKILSLLVDLLAEQNGVRVKYQIIKREGRDHEEVAKGA